MLEKSYTRSLQERVQCDSVGPATTFLSIGKFTRPEGVLFVITPTYLGLHWFGISPKGLCSITSPKMSRNTGFEGILDW